MWQLYVGVSISCTCIHALTQLHAVLSSCYLATHVEFVNSRQGGQTGRGVYVHVWTYVLQVCVQQYSCVSYNGSSASPICSLPNIYLYSPVITLPPPNSDIPDYLINSVCPQPLNPLHTTATCVRRVILPWSEGRPREAGKGRVREGHRLTLCWLLPNCIAHACGHEARGVYSVCCFIWLSQPC